MGRYFADLAVMTGRCLRHVFRSLDTIITVVLMPVAFLLLFVYVLGGAIDTGGGNYTNYLLPGILLITVASGASYGSYRLFGDVSGGIFERFHSMPIARSTILWGHAASGLLANLVSAVIVVGVAFAAGFRPSAGPLAWLAVLGLLMLFNLALTWISMIAGLTAKTPDGAGAFAYPIIFLPFISSAFVPTAPMPGPVRWFAENQPVTAIVDSMRALLDGGTPAGRAVWIALAWLAAATAVAYALAMRAYHHRTTR